MGHSHSHAFQDPGDGKRLLIALVLNVGITIAQVIGGMISGSLSLLADAAHNGSDAASLGVSWGARRIAERKADRTRTFGYRRAEVIGALINLTTLIVIAVFLAWQAAMRFMDPPAVEGEVMLVVGAIAFVEDAVSAWLLFRGQKTSLNLRSAFIHMIGDTLATVGVIVGGFLVLEYEIYWVDPAITAIIAVYIFVHALVEIRHSAHILMESAPTELDFERMIREVEALPGVEDMHHIHVWRLDEHRVALEAHVEVLEHDLQAIEEIKKRVKSLLHNEFDICHATLEIEVAGKIQHDRSVIQLAE